MDAAFVIAFGVFLICWGIYCYVGPNAARLNRVVGPFVNIIYSYIPFGLSCTIVGSTMLIGRGPLVGPLIIVALPIMALGLLLWFWHPHWIRPTWLRNDWGD